MHCLLFFCTVTDFAVYLNEGDFVFGNASLNYFGPFSTLFVENANAIFFAKLFSLWNFVDQMFVNRNCGT